MSGGNLIVNGDAEAQPGAEWEAVSGGLTRHLYGADGYPSAVVLGEGPFAGGEFLFYGAGGSPEVRQTVGLTADDQAAIDAGTVKARLSAFLGGYGTQGDRMGLTARWHDAAGQVLLVQTLAPVTEIDRDGVSGFLRREDLAAVPAGARSVVLTLAGQRFAGSAHDGYADNLKLQLVDIPRVQPAFAAERLRPGAATRLTFAVQNSADLEAKPEWSFTQQLPDGLRVASTSFARTTCAGVVIRGTPSRITVGGGPLPAGPGCAVSVDVTSDRPGTYVLDPSDTVSDVGLHQPSLPAAVTFAGPTLVVPAGGGAGPEMRPGSDRLTDATPAPAPAPTFDDVLSDRFVSSLPTASPVLPASSGPRGAVLAPSLRIEGPRSTVPVGARGRFSLRLKNRTTLPVGPMRVCLRVPAAFAPSTSRVSRRRCWRNVRVEPGATWARTVGVRALRPSTAGGAVATATFPGTRTPQLQVRSDRKGVR